VSLLEAGQNNQKDDEAWENNNATMVDDLPQVFLPHFKLIFGFLNLPPLQD